MKKLLARLVFLVCLVAGVFPAAHADDQSLIVATRQVPPFAMKDKEGHWHGIAITLWREIANKLHVNYEFREMALAEMLGGLKTGKVDVAVAALTITSEREKAFDFSHPFMASGLGKVVVKKEGDTVWLLLQRVFSYDFLRIFMGLIALLLFVGFLVWIFERGKNDQFSEKPAEGIGAGLWWSAVTMTTVGYGDKAPATVGGRIVGLVWMFIGIVLISSFTAAFTTILTVGQLNADHKSGLEGMKLMTVKASTAEDYLRRNHFSPRTVTDLDMALKQLQQGVADVVVYDIPILRYTVKTHFSGDLVVLPEMFEHQSYGIGLPSNSLYREAINLALLEYLDTGEWQDLLVAHLGR